MLCLMKKLIVLLLAGVAVLPAAPPDAKAEKEVMAAMNAWKQAVVKKDRPALEKIYHPDLSYGHSSGLVENKEQAIQHIVGSKGSYEEVDLADMSFRTYGNIALVSGKVTIHERGADGKMQIIPLSVLHVWIKGPQGWQMVGRQSTRPTT
jgi:ketosteroid isomerase-like protein